MRMIEVKESGMRSGDKITRYMPAFGNLTGAKFRAIEFNMTDLHHLLQLSPDRLYKRIQEIDRCLTKPTIK
jgi:hypothetical protein